ncbi:hypothetical protein [Tenacibaculum litopenaei]|uniref:hypothetical protein n=1 Tax=Tenacibaculum litopenaei TaxID=396016 RepID=UPI0038B6A9CD
MKKKIRKADSLEEKGLNYREYVAPVGSESALKAYYKIFKWDECYDELLHNSVLKSMEIVKGVDKKPKKKWFS